MRVSVAYATTLSYPTCATGKKTNSPHLIVIQPSPTIEW